MVSRLVILLRRVEEWYSPVFPPSALRLIVPNRISSYCVVKPQYRYVDHMHLPLFISHHSTDVSGNFVIMQTKSLYKCAITCSLGELAKYNGTLPHFSTRAFMRQFLSIPQEHSPVRRNTDAGCFCFSFWGYYFKCNPQQWNNRDIFVSL